jgi:hypothetical protein
MKSLLYIFTLLLSFCAFAQQGKVDKIYLNNGSVLEVNVKKVGSSVIEYTYPNESAQNEEQVGNVRTIVFASGRVQQFNTGNTTASAPPAAAPAASAAVEYREVQPNSLAILPVAFYDKLSGKLWEDHSKLAQSRIYDFFEDDASKIAPLKMQDTRTTNAYLRKANIDYAQLDETPIEDLEKILGSEYLVLSKVTCEVKSKSTLNETTYGGTEKKGNREVGAVHTSSSVNEDKSYNYVVVLEIYKGGQKIYNETRKPFLNMEDSWKDAMEYMLKRAPIYKRK